MDLLAIRGIDRGSSEQCIHDALHNQVLCPAFRLGSGVLVSHYTPEPVPGIPCSR